MKMPVFPGNADVLVRNERGSANELVLEADESRADADEDVRVPGICVSLLKICHDLSVDPLDDYFLQT